MGLVWVRFFSSTFREDFFLDIQRCKIFWSIIKDERYFFQCSIFPQVVHCKIFVSLEIRSAGLNFFLNHPYHPHKLNGRPLFLSALTVQI